MTTNPNNHQPDLEYSAAEIEAGAHRQAVGGRWDEIGELQLTFLIENGLAPSDQLLDVGCGSLRAGVRLIDYLDSGHYFGTDLLQGLLDAGRFMYPLEDMRYAARSTGWVFDSVVKWDHPKGQRMLRFTKPDQ